MVYLKDVKISGCHTGITNRTDSGPAAIRIGRGLPVHADGVEFENTLKPYDLVDAPSCNITNNRVRHDPKHSATHHVVSGWTRPKGPPLPVYCPKCHGLFPSANYVFGGTYFNCWGNTETCKFCGFESARLAEGVFNLAKNLAQVLSAPSWTYQAFEELHAAAEGVLAGRLSPVQFRDQFDRQIPGSAKSILERSRLLDNGWQILAVLIMIMTLFRMEQMHSEQLRNAEAHVAREERRHSESLEASREILSELEDQSEMLAERELERCLFELWNWRVEYGCRLDDEEP